MKEYVRCKICDRKFKMIGYKHLKQHNLTLQEYKDCFPDAPIRSELSVMIKRRSASKANLARVGVARSTETIKKIKQTKKENPKTPWNKGQHSSQESKDRLSRTRKKLFVSGELIHWNYGNITPDNTKQKIRDTALKQQRSYSVAAKTKRLVTIQQKIDAGWVHHSTQRFFDKISPSDLANKYNNKDWLYEQHITKRRTISSICVELGLHWKHSHHTVKTQIEQFGIPIKYWAPASSQAQVDLTEYIDSLGVLTISNDRKLISPLELDIVIPELKVAIEYCGLYWHSNVHRATSYHKNKHDLCHDIGYRLLTIYEDEWLNTSEIVKRTISNILHLNTTSIFARTTSVVNVDSTTRQLFLDEFHVQGNGQGSVTYGLSHDNTLVAVMTFKRTGGSEWLLNRYASSVRVVGGFTKLLAHFKRNNQWSAIITFADLRWSSGDLYYKTGFSFDKLLPPDYQCIHNGIRRHKFNYRHSKLKNMLTNYNPNESETLNMDRHKILRIFDCGKIKFRMSNS